MAITLNYDKIRSTATNPYAMTNNWDLVIANVPDALSALTLNMLGAGGQINARCIQVNNLPNSNLSEKILAGKVRDVPFHQAAGRESSVKEINLKIYEYWDYRIFQFFECWKSLAVNRMDFSQNQQAMIPSGVSIVWYDTDRQTEKLIYNLFDVVCTKCNLPDFTSESEFVQTQVSLKCGYYNIVEPADGRTLVSTASRRTMDSGSGGSLPNGII